MNITPSTRVRIPDGVLIREVAGESVVLDLNTERYFGLDEVGTRIWTVLTTSDTIQVGIDTLLDEYDVDQETLADDVAELVEKLVNHGLLAVNDE
jgi:hypothetical protein